MTYEYTNKDSIQDGKTVESHGQEDSFAVLLEKTGNLPVRLVPGQKIETRVVCVSKEHVYVDLPGKTEGVIDLNEFFDDNGALSIEEGAKVEAFFLSVKDGVRQLTTLINGYSPSKLRDICDARDAGLPVQGDVKRALKGGFEVSVGGVRCFCPFSQIDLNVSRNSSIYLGRTFPFMILEYEDGGRNIVVSRRILLEQEREARIDRLKGTLEVGMEIKGTVGSIQKFGAFVDIGGIDGLIPSSEISWARNEKIDNVLSVGQEVTVKVIALDWDNTRLTLSLKAMKPDPWITVEEKYKVDSRVKGTVVRLAPFGAFVNLETGVDGLVHISNLGAGRRINHPKEVVENGQLVEAYVLSVDSGNRKISLSLQPKPKPRKIVLPAPGELVEGVVEKVMPYGIFLKINAGIKGLIPNAEMGTPHGSDHKSMFSAGVEMQAVVIEVDKENNRIRLSRKAAIDREAKEEYREYADSVKQAQGSFNTLGDLGNILRAKLDEKK